MRMPKLVAYDAAIAALATVNRVDEVKKIHDEGIALKLYGKLAKDDRIQRYGVALRVRAERRLGQLMALQAQTVGKATASGSNQHKERVARRPDALPTLAEAGIDKHLAQRARETARMPEAEFEKSIDATLDPSSAPPKPRPRRKARTVFEVVSVPVSEIFEANARQAAALADKDYSDLEVDASVLRIARSVIDAWSHCIAQLEERHGQKSIRAGE